MRKICRDQSQKVKLEVTLGVSLFNRNTRNGALTEAGQELVKDAKKVLDHVQRFVENADDHARHELPSPISHAPTNTTQALASTSIGTDSNAAPVHGPSIHKPSSNLKSALW
jgi:hypothetical protein